MNEAIHMTVEKKTIRSDIPGHHAFLNGSAGFTGSPAEETRRMVVSRNITLAAEISDCEHMVVEGTVKAQAFAARRLDVLETGLFSGGAQVQDAVIAGRFEGRLTVSGRLTIKSTGRVSGEVTYGTLEVEGGAKLGGQVSPLSFSAPVDMAAPAAPKARKEEVQVSDNVEPLFSDTDETTGPKRTRGFRRAVGF